MDTILQFYNDLATLPKSDIYTLASFYDLSGSFTDLLWLIAIKHYYSYNKAELKGAQLEFAEKLPKIIEIGEVSFNPEFLEKLDKLIKDKKEIRKTKDIDEKKRLGKAIKQVEKEIEKDPEWVRVMDLKKRFEVLPEYYSWILQSYLDRTLSRLEDIKARLIPAINLYNKLKELGKLKDKTEIKQLKGLKGLEDYLDNYKDEIRDMEGERTENIEKMDKEGPIVYDGEKVVIRQPKTEAAACYFGRDTRWCTAKVEGDNLFEDYNEDGPLYIIIPKDPDYKGEKYQFHEDSQQYLNEKDEDFDLIKFMDKYEPDMAKIDELTDFYNKNGLKILRAAIGQNKNNLIDKYEKYATGQIFCAIFNAGRDDLIERFEKYMDADGLACAVMYYKNELIFKYLKYLNTYVIELLIDGKQIDFLNDALKLNENYKIEPAVIEFAFSQCDLKLLKIIIDNVDLQNEEIAKKIFNLTVYFFEYCQDKDILNYLLSLDYRISTYIDDFRYVFLNSEFTPSDVSKITAKITVNPEDEETLIKDIIKSINSVVFRKEIALQLDEKLQSITQFIKNPHYKDFLQAVKNISTTANIEPLKQVQFSEREVMTLIILSIVLDKWEVYKYLFENNNIYTDIWRIGNSIESTNPDQKYGDLFLQKVREVVTKLDSDTVASIINTLPEREQKIALNDPIIKPHIILDKLELAPEYINELLQDA